MPVASFRSPEQVLGTNEVAFDATSSYSHGADIASYSWDFGDGSTGEGQTVSHTYADAALGTYWVTLTVTDANGQSDDVRQRVVVAPDYLPALEENVADLTPGYKYEHWSASLRKAKRPEDAMAIIEKTVATEPEMTVAIEKFQFERKEKVPGADRKAGIRRRSGFPLGTHRWLVCLCRRWWSATHDRWPRGVGLQSGFEADLRTIEGWPAFLQSGGRYARQLRAILLDAYGWHPRAA